MTNLLKTENIIFLTLLIGSGLQRLVTIFKQLFA
ncbi:hypothetical protein swp_3409 [Shewanella piezotolerans WP3]|uniref:Uncharacterized protein n=1 Tax=Shewanella piezotolerans (strain WP3 / JCM 13877) TaxID=225849 RepID=B8CRV1_SHEPW|nr:hypothetical protein swp_3409 [Shewanella piezotolerans WP3]